MARYLGFLLGFLSLFTGSGVSDWNIFNQNRKSGLRISLNNYCESWRMNVELNNIQGFDVVPEECVQYIGQYMTSTQYKVDCERAVEECTVYLSSCCCTLKGDGRDAWIFDVDDTLLSTLPFYKNHYFGGEGLNLTSIEKWKSESKAPALENSLKLFNEIKGRGIKIILISSRREHLRDATVDNLINAGYHGWASLILRGPEDESKEVQKYKAETRKQLISNGYRIWGIVGDQWSSLKGLPSGKRTFKLPNSMYHVS